MSDLREQYGLIKKLSVWFDTKSIIVLTMGKVGTLTICNSLDKIEKKHVHPHSLRYTRPGIHFLKNVNLSFFKKKYYNYKTTTKRMKVFFWLSQAKEVTVITGVRDPFSRAISAFFEQAHYLNMDPNLMKYDDAYTAFENHYDLEGGVQWFDNEINKVFGVDIYKSPFDKTKGFQVLIKDKYRIFIYRLDFLSDLEDALKTFLNNENFRIENANETADSENYKQIKKNKKFTTSEFKFIEESKYMRHFYTEEEITELKEKWLQ